MKFKTSFITLIGLCSVACDDTTDTIGIFTDSDNINASTSVYEASTQSLLADSVLSNSNSSYLGRMTDPETNMQIKAEFLAQFSTLENYEFPAYDLMVKNEQGEIEAVVLLSILAIFLPFPPGGAKRLFRALVLIEAAPDAGGDEGHR